MRRLCILALVAVIGCATGRGAGGGRPSDAELARADKAFAAGKFDDGLPLVASARARLGARDRQLVAFGKKYEPVLLAEADRRAKGKHFGGAYLIARQVSTLFGSSTGAARATTYADAWRGELAAGAERAASAGHHGTEVIYRAALAAISPDGAAAEAATRAAAALRDKHRLALQLQAKGDATRMTAGFAGDPRFAGGSDAADTVVLAVSVGAQTSRTDVRTTRETIAVDGGTQTVDNPAYADAQAAVAQHEDQIKYLQEQREAEEQSPTRDQSSLDNFDYQISNEQADLDAANDNLAATPPTIDQATTVDREYPVEIHTLVVSRDVKADARFTGGGKPVARAETVSIKREDRAHAAEGELGLDRDPVELPSAQSLTGELDAAVATWLGTALDDVYTAYRERLLAGGDRSEGLALYVALDPAHVPANVAGELAGALGVPTPDRLLAALADGRVAEGFDGMPTGAGQEVAPAIADAAPAPTTKPRPAPTTTATTATTTATATKAKPSPPAADPLAGKAGHALKLTAFEIQRAGKAIVSVAKDGTFTSGTTPLGVWQRDGTLIDSAQRLVYAIDNTGKVWVTSKHPTAVVTLAKGKVVADNGIELSFDKTGHVVATTRRGVLVSEEVISPLSATKYDLALVVAFLAYPKLKFATK